MWVCEEQLDVSILTIVKTGQKSCDLICEWIKFQKGRFPEHAQTKEIVSLRKGITWKILGQTLLRLRFPFF